MSIEFIGYISNNNSSETIVRQGPILDPIHIETVAKAHENAGFDRGIDSTVASQLSMAAGFVMPHLLETSPTETWVGFRPASDKLHLGRWQSGRVYLAYGHYRNGILLAPVLATKFVA